MTDYRSKAADAVTAAEALLTRAEADNREFTDDERTEYDGLLERAEKSNRLAQVAAVAATNNVRTESGFGAGVDVVTRTHKDPWDGLDHSLAGDSLTGLRTRAAVAIEAVTMPDESKNMLTDLVTRDDGSAAFYTLATSSPHYASAFAKLAADPERGHLRWTPEEQRTFGIASEYQRTMQIGGSGAYLAPVMIDPTIILTNVGVQSGIRSVARQETIATSIWHGVSSAGVTASWLAESTEASDASPTFLQPTITPQKAAAYVEFSIEMQGDTNITGQLGELFADSKLRLEEAAFATGSGSGAPNGVITGLVAASKGVTSSATGSYSVVDIYAMKSALPARYRANAKWVASEDVADLTRQFATGSGPQSAYWTDLGGGTPPSLVGHDFVISSGIATAITSSSKILVYGDWSNYLIVDRLGATVEFVPLVVGTNRRPNGDRGAFMYWRTGADLTNADGLRYLVLK
jgi:HK97 family phage major capsid protein